MTPAETAVALRVALKPPSSLRGTPLGTLLEWALRHLDAYTTLLTDPKLAAAAGLSTMSVKVAGIIYDHVTAFSVGGGWADVLLHDVHGNPSFDAAHKPMVTRVFGPVETLTG